MQHTIYMKGRLDTTTATTFDAQIEGELAALAEAPTSLTFDCTDLEYISSTGLRVILKYKKLINDVRITGASVDVYNVFEMTGFARIIPIERALRRIDLSQCERIAQGGNGAVYRISDEEIVKVQHLAETEYMMIDELRRAQAAFVLGIPTAISFGQVDCGDGRHGAVYEALNSDTLGRHLHKHPEQIREYAAKYDTLLHTLHTTEADAEEFGCIRDHYLRAYENAVQYFTPEELTLCHEVLDTIPERATLVHGDAHTNNFLLGPDGELMFIDMADVSLGHPIFDIAGIGLAMIGSQSRAERCISITGLHPDEANAFLATAFAARFQISDPDEVKTMMLRIANLGMFKYTMIMGHSSQLTNQLKPLLLKVIRERFFPNVEQVKADIRWFAERL